MSRTRVTTGAARAVARLAKQVEVALGPLDLSLPQYRVLALLGEGSTASSVLARRLAVSPPSVTAVVDGLVGAGSRRAPGRPRGPPPAHAAAHPRRQAGARRRPTPPPRRASTRSRLLRRAARRARRRTRQLEPRARPQPRGAREARPVTIEMGAFGADVSSPFVPVGVTPRYPPPRAHIKPDRGGSVAPADDAGGAGAQVDVRLLAGRVVPRPRGAGADPERGRPGDRRAGQDHRPVARVLRRPSSWCSR